MRKINPSSIGKKILIAGAIVISYTIWKADVFWNYYQFKQLCAAEGGLKIFEPLGKGMGWQEKPNSTTDVAMWYASHMPNIGFFRVNRTQYDPLPELGLGEPIDVRYVGGPTLPSTSYEFKPSDLTRPVVYEIHTKVNDKTPENSRTNLVLFQVREAESQKVMLVYSQFQFNWRTIPYWHWFGPSGTTGCPLADDEGLRDIALINKTAFKE